MTRATGTQPAAAALGVFLNGDAAAHRRRRDGEPLPRRLVPRPLQRAPRADSQFLLPPVASGVAGGSSCRPRSPDAVRRAPLGPHARSSPSSRRGRSWCCAGVALSVTDLVATYRLQLGAGLRFASRARARAVPPASSASATSTCRRSCRPARGRRTATTSSTRPASPTRSAARTSCGRWPAAGARRRARRRPEPHGRGRREPVLATTELRGSSSTSTP